MVAQVWFICPFICCFAPIRDGRALQGGELFHCSVDERCWPPRTRRAPAGIATISAATATTGSDGGDLHTERHAA